MTDHLKKLIKTAIKLEQALAEYGQSPESYSVLRSEEMMGVAIRYGVYPTKPIMGFKQENWDNGGPVRKLVSKLDEHGVQPKSLISCEYKKALNKDSHSNPRFKTDRNEYYFYPQQAAKKKKNNSLTMTC